METKDFAAIVDEIESKNNEIRQMNTRLRELIDDTQAINSILAESIKAEIAKEKKCDFIKEMLK